MGTQHIHPSIKLTVIAFAAAVATCACFYLMFFLIAQELQAPIEIPDTPYLTPSMTSHKPTEEVIATRRKPEKILPLNPPNGPDFAAINKTTWVELQSERPVFGSIADLLGPSDVQLELEAPHSDLFPLSVVQPIYPISAAMREIEGYVVVEFSVRENGTVLNPTVVQSAPEVLFDQAALNAVTRFKFKPREVGGEHVRVDKVQMKFSFNLESLYDIPETQ